MNTPLPSSSHEPGDEGLPRLLTAAFLAASAGSLRSRDGFSINQCIGIIDPTPAALQPLGMLIRLQERRAGAAAPLFGTPEALAASLHDLHQQKLELLDLHGQGAYAKMGCLDARILAVSTVLHPLLLLANPTAREIVLALRRSPDRGLLVKYDQIHCETFLSPTPSQSTRHLLRMLGRGYRGETLIPDERSRQTEPILNPALSLLFCADRLTMSRLLATRLFQTEGLSEHVLLCDSARPSETELQCLWDAMEGVVRDRDLLGARIDAPQWPTWDAREVAAAMKPSLRTKIEAAAHFWAERTGRPLDPRSVEGSASHAIRIRASLLAYLAVNEQVAEEQAMMDKLRKLGPCKLRTLMRTYAKQKKAQIQPILDRLVNDRRAVVSQAGKIHLISQEGDFSGAQLITA